MKKTVNVIFLSIIGVLYLAGCSIAPTMVQVPMAYTPTNPVEPPRTLKDTPIYFAPFQDQRKNSEQVGENKEKEPSIPAKSSPEAVMSALEKAFKDGFNRAGLNVVESQDQAQRIIRVTLQNLWVEEKNTFDAVVGVNVEVKDRTGQVLASEGFNGVKKRWGSSYSAEEYRKVISDAYMEMINNIFKNDTFMQKML
jgi:hypothetical protein